MDRRDFIKLCSVAGIGVVSVAAPGMIPRARAASSRLWVFVHASGGWDPTLLTDPKGSAMNSKGFVVNNTFAADEIKTAGAVSYAPSAQNEAFFGDAKYRDILTVINGIDCETNGHDTGTRNTWAGRLSNNTPAFAALLCAATADALPLSFLTNGGYDYTDGVSAPTRLGNGGALEALLHPNRINPVDEKSELYVTDDTLSRIRDARASRLDALRAEQHLPRVEHAMSLLFTSRLGMDDLKLMSAELAKVVAAFGDLGQGLVRQARIAVAAYKAGLTAAVNLSSGGFDTHGNHDGQHPQRLGELLDGVRALYDCAEALECRDELFTVVGSDFGRTPQYNDGNGKDHWSVTSMLILSPDLPGNRVIGATDDAFVHTKIDLATLKLGGKDAIKPGHIHKWLRKFAGIEDHPIVRRYPITVKGDLDLG
ncbi:MAG: DUF1501 domain-containing protein [Myxococcales bacterium]|nr:DUF1501 domain-containing protein [Myxococcales bacterium]